MTQVNRIRYHMDVILRNVIEVCEKEWKTRPRCVLACRGASDEHWQVWHPARMGTEDHPAYTVDKDGEVFC
jgi:hypothetical protein